MKRSTFGRSQPKLTREEVLEARNARIASLMAAVQGGSRSSATMTGSTTSAVPKTPADRLPALRELAEGEECCVRYEPVCRRDTAHTVLAHTNTQADQKGMGYKGHDSAGFPACDRCHYVIDQGALTARQVATMISAAQLRWHTRLQELAQAVTQRPWRVQAARAALEMIEARGQ